MVLLYVLQVHRFSLQNGVDPFIYLGYQQDTPDLVDRYGWLYFPVRFGLLWPAQLSTAVFGIVPGYFALRYLLALLALGSLVRLGRTRGSALSGWSAGVVCLASPVFIAAVMTLYADTVGLPCLLAGCALLLQEGPGTRRRALVAGLLFGVAFHANFFVVLPLLGAFGPRAVLQLARGEWRRLLDYVLVGASVLAVTVVGMVTYRVLYGTFDLLGPTLDAARKYSGDAGQSFRQNNHVWLRISPHLYIPPLVALGLLGLVLTRTRTTDQTRWAAWSRPGAIDALVMLLGAVVAFGLQQFLLDGYAVETYYYYSYAFAFVGVALVFVFAELADRGGQAPVLAAVGVAVAAPLIRNLAFEDLEVWVLPWVPLVTVAVVLALVATRWWRPVATLAAGMVATAVGLLAFAPPSNVPLEPGMSFRVEPRYETMLGNAARGDLAVYLASAELVEVLPKWDDDPGSNIYWYDSESALLNAAQATQYWRTVALQELGRGGPRLTRQEARQLKVRTPRHLIILSETSADLEKRVARVQRAVEPVNTEHETVGAAPSVVHVAILTFTPSPCDIHYRGRVPWLELPPCP